MLKNLLFGASLCAMLFNAPASNAGSLSVLYNIKGSGDGAQPQSDLLLSGGAAFGTTFAGGKTGQGSIYSVDLQSGKVTTLYSFTGGKDSAYPTTGLVQYGEKFYGTTSGTYPATKPTVFRFDPASNSLATIAVVSTLVGDLVAANGLLYGVKTNPNEPEVGASVVSIDPKTGTVTTVYTFNPNDGDPLGGLTATGTTLYGTLAGSIFKIDLTTGEETTIWNFGAGGTANDGSRPVGRLAVSGAILYGATQDGGANNYGTVFKIDLTTGAESVLYSFRGAQDGASPQFGVVASHGMLYGVTQGQFLSGPRVGETYGYGTVFSINPKTGRETTLHTFSNTQDGGYPFAALSVINGVVYGAAESGGTFGAGVLFSIDTSTRQVSTVYSFSGLDGSSNPGLTNVGGTLYGVAGDGGPYGGGTVFKIDPATGKPSTVFNFTGAATGANPNSALVESSGLLYGTTGFGGSNSAGTVFKLNPANGHQSVLYSFKGGADGQYPGNLVALGGTLYGTTGFNYGKTAGTVFAVDPTTGAKTTLHGFNASSGTPAGLVAFSNRIFGITETGGTGAGSIFELNPNNAVFRTVHSFTCESDGCFPTAGLSISGSMLLGAGLFGGTNGGGVVFSFDPASDTVAPIYNFGTTAYDGNFPMAPILASGSTLFGTTLYGGTGLGGTLFEVNSTTGAETILYNFGNTLAGIPQTSGGYSPAGALTEAGGVLYGTTSAGGPGNAGTIFSFAP